jgi:hypothetical protein
MKREWICPMCGDLIENMDERIEHLVIRHSLKQNITEFATGMIFAKMERVTK